MDLFIDDKLSFDKNVIASNHDNNQITIDSSKVAEIIKKHYLEDIAKIIANDNKMIALVTEKLESNVQAELEGSNNKSYQSDKNSNDSNVSTKSTNTPEKGNEAVRDDSEEAKTFEDSRVKIKQWHSQSQEMKDIIKELNKGSYPTKTGSVGKWRSNQVKSILKSFSQNKT